jgi:hypothetical protein
MKFCWAIRRAEQHEKKQIQRRAGDRDLALRAAYGLLTPRVAIHPTTIHNINLAHPNRALVLICPSI